MENMVTVFLFGKKYEVPDSLTIMEAMEYSGYQLVRGCGWRHGLRPCSRVGLGGPGPAATASAARVRRSTASRATAN